MEYFTLRAGRGQPEHSIRLYDPQVETLLADLLADPQIAAAHNACETAHAAAIRDHAARMDETEMGPRL
jgi:hypothetical protein